MPTEERTQIVKFQGGLNLANSELDSIETPGWCESMINFEADIKGGYRFINGFTPIGGGSATIPGTVDASVHPVAVYPYYKGSVAVRQGNVFYSEDGITWIQVNKDTSGGFVDAATLAGLSALPRTTNGLESYNFAAWNNGTDEELVFVDDRGDNPIAKLVIRDNGGTEEYKYQEATAADWGGISRYPSVIAVLGDRFLYGKDPANKASVYNTGLFDPFGFVSGGEVNISDEVEAVRSFRENAIVFGRNTIHSWTQIGDVTQEAILPITTNMGCIAGGSVQEVGGDLIFLGPDGLRTLAGTDQIGDVELGSLSFNINEGLQDYIDSINTYKVSSTVIRKRSNYRLFFHDKDTTTYNQVGFGMVIRREGSSSVYEWNKFSSYPVWDVNASFDSDGVERVYSTANVDAHPKVCIHNSGSTFDGRTIGASFKVPNVVMEDPELRKTLYKVRVYSKGEGTYNYSFKLTYDSGDANAMSPALYSTNNESPESTYGGGSYGTAVYGGGSRRSTLFNVQGSGRTFDVTFTSIAGSDPFTVQGVSISYTTNGRY